MIAALLLVLSGAPASPPPLDAPLYRERLEEILARREFRAVPREADAETKGKEVKPPPFFRWLVERIGDSLAAVFEWLAKWLMKDPAREGSVSTGIGSISQPAVYALALGAAVLLAIVVLRVFRKVDAPALPPPPSATALARGAQPDALAQPAEAWARLAESFARKGEWRLALRAAFLELLVLLHERGAIRYERQRTNGEYADVLASGPAGRPFGLLVGAFDEAWYGNRPFGEPAYRKAIEWARGVDRATARAAALEGAS